MQEIRCGHCRKKLGEGIYHCLAIKCPRCGTLNQLRALCSASERHLKEQQVESSPIIPWMGGKRRLADRLILLFPAHECYVEVFCGGAALYFLRPVPAHTEVINDINGELVNLYRIVQHYLEEFVRQFKWALTSRQIFKWHQTARLETLTDIQRAARFFYLNSTHSVGKCPGRTSGQQRRCRRSICAALRRALVRLTFGWQALTWRTCPGWNA